MAQVSNCVSLEPLLIVARRSSSEIFGSLISFFSAAFSGRTWIGLARGAGSVTLPTSFVGKGPHSKQWLVMLLSAPDSFLTEVFVSCKANDRKSVSLAPVSSHSIIFTSVTDPGQMAYQAANLWLWPEPVGVAAAFWQCRLYWAGIHNLNKSTPLRIVCSALHCFIYYGCCWLLGNHIKHGSRI